jgi:thioredoxin-related protein
MQATGREDGAAGDRWWGIATAGVLLAALLVPAPHTRADDRDPREHFFVRSFGDLPEELEVAREEGKAGLLLFFEQPGCPYCERMLRGVLSDSLAQDWFAGHFRAIAVNIRSDVELTDLDGIKLPSRVFAEHRRVFATPVMSFIALDGTEVFRRSREVRSREELLLLGGYVASQAYADTSFETYAASRGGPGPAQEAKP